MVKKKNNFTDVSRDISFLEESLSSQLLPGDHFLSGVKKEKYLSLMEKDLQSKKIELEKILVDSPEGVGNSKGKEKLEYFLVVAASQELDAGLAWIDEKGWGVEKQNIANRTGRRIEMKLANGSKLNVGMLCATHKGNMSSRELISDVVRHESPKCLLMVGMMGGIPGKVNLMDIVCPMIVYDGTAIGTKDGAILLEGRPLPMHERIPDILNNLGSKTYKGIELNIIKNKHSVSVGEKIDDLTPELSKAILDKDAENIVGLEMEAYAVTHANLHQQLHDENVVFGVFKSVADFCSTIDEIDDKTSEKIAKLVDLNQFSEPHNPTKNKELKAKLQSEGTKLSFELAMYVLEDLSILHSK